MLVQPSPAKFIDLIYAALLGESTWQHFLDEICTILPNGRAVLFFHDYVADRGALSLNAHVPPECVAAYASYYADKNPWTCPIEMGQVGRAVATESMVSRDELRRTEFYNDYLRPQEAASAVGATIMRDENVNFMISIVSGEVEEAQTTSALNCLQPLTSHLHRAARFYRGEAGSEQSLTSVGPAEDGLRAGVLRIGPGGKLRAYNAAAARLLQQGSGIGIDLAGRLRCSHSCVVDHVDALLSSWPELPHGFAARSFPIRRKEDAPPLRLTVLPPRTAIGEAFFRGPECIVLVEEPYYPLGSAAEMMALFYGLTSAETQILAALGAGQSVVEIADSRQVSPETVRVQIKQIFAKTGMNRQVNLVRTLYSYAITAVDLGQQNI